MNKPERYVQMIEVRKCLDCGGVGVFDSGDPINGPVSCLTCDGFGYIEQERRIGSLLDLYSLLLDIRRDNDKAEAEARQNAVM
jgi:hypothetical protein